MDMSLGGFGKAVWRATLKPAAALWTQGGGLVLMLRQL